MTKPSAYAVFFLLSTIASFAHAQPTPTRAQHRLGLAAGYTGYAVFDRAATSLAYRAPLTSAGLDYVGDTARWRWSARAVVSYGVPRSVSYPDRTIDIAHYDAEGTRDDVHVPMRGSLLAPLFEIAFERVFAHGPFAWTLGASARFEIVRAQGFVSPGLMQLATIRPSIGLRYALGQGSAFELSLRVPVAGYMARLPYHQSVSLPGASQYEGLNRQGGGFRTLDELQGLELEASYRVRLGRHIGVRALYHFEWLRDATPRLLVATQSRAQLALDYYF